MSHMFQHDDGYDSSEENTFSNNVFNTQYFNTLAKM